MGKTVVVPLPRAERPMLVRPRLLEWLRGRWFTRVTVVVAPAGYGKTTLLTQMIDANRAAPLGIDCWLACGTDTGGSVAATALGTGLRRMVGATSPPTPGPNDSVVGDVSEAVWRRSPEHVALVIDDVHKIPPESEAASLLAALVEALPANGHLVLAGRVRPPVPLARLEVEGRVARLEETDLAFTDDELTRFAALRSVPPSQLAACGGWPALAELTASAPASQATLTGEYFGQEVLASLSRDRRQHLALLAHLGPFDEELARAALGAEVDVAELLDGIPLVSRIPGGVSVLHPLWRTVLADEVDSADIATSRRRAAGVMVQRREPDRAIPLLIDAAAWDELGEVFVILLGAAHAAVPRDVLADWYGRLPTEAQSGPYGQLLAAALAVEADPGAAGDQLELCAARFRGAGSAAGEAACIAQLARLAWWSHEPERLVALATRASELAAEGCQPAVALACLGRALVHDLQNDLRQMLVELDRVPPGSLNRAWQGVVSYLRSLAYLQLGDPDRALVAAEHAVAHAGDVHAPLAEGMRIQALWFSGRTAEALDAMPALLERLEASGHRIAIGAAQCSVAFASVGDNSRAEALLVQARTAAVETEAPLFDTNLALAVAAVAVLAGDEDAARQELTACLDRHPLRQGLSATAHVRNLGLIYVLVPETRPMWDDAELGGVFLVARNLARAVAAVRDDGRLPADAPPLPDIGIVQAFLPLPWIAQLAVAAADAGRADGWRILHDTWPAARPAVVKLAADATNRLRSTAREALSRLPVPPTARFHLRLLGQVELRKDGARVDGPEWRRERVRALLAYLVLNGTASRERVAEDLWPDRDVDVQSRNLRVTLTYLLRVLEPDRGPRDVSYFVRQQRGNLTLHTGEWLTVDTWDLETVCQQAADADLRGAPSVALDRGLQAAQIWRSEPDELSTEPWAIAPIERWRRAFTTAVTRSGELLLGQGDNERALALAERVLRADPWLERAHRLVVAAHLAHHDHLAAHQAVARYQTLVHELGVGPDEATRMVERLLATTRGTSRSDVDGA